MIISRYLAKEVLYTMIAVTAIVVFIFICNRFVRYLGFVASGKYAAHMLIYLTLLQIPLLFGMLLPLGLFLGILLGYGRLYADSEMTVLSACGFSYKQLLITTMKFATGIAIIVAILVLWAGPKIAKQRDLMIDIAEANSVFQTIMPGSFQSSLNGKRVFYVQDMTADRQSMAGLFLAQQLKKHKTNNPNSSAQNWMVIAAKTGYQTVNATTKDKFIVANDGYRYEGVPGQKDFKIVKFAKYGIRLNAAPNIGKHEGEEVIPTKKLLHQAINNPINMAELQWRISFPISVFILALLAVPLSQVKPRHGRFAQLIPAILLYIFYANMIFISHDWLQNETIPSWIGLWWIHFVIFILACLLIVKQTGVRLQKT